MRVLEYIGLALRYRADPFFVKYLQGRRVLDVGSGRGEFLMRDPEHFVGIDVDPALVACCRDRQLSAFCMSALCLDFSDGSFDAVHAAQLIEHFDPIDAVRFVHEAARVVRDGGVVLLTTPGVKNVWNTFSHVRPYPPDAFRKLLKSDTENYIRDSGIPLVLETAWGQRHYFESRLITFLLSVLDLLWKPGNPIGWVIVLRKTKSTAGTG
jgi:SAM-dependent methyltransferase